MLVSRPLRFVRSFLSLIRVGFNLRAYPYAPLLHYGQKENSIWLVNLLFRLSLVADIDEVVGKLLDGVGGGARLDALGVVGHKDGLGGLDDDNALSAL